MDDRLWPIIAELLPPPQPPGHHRRRFDDRTVLAVGLWAILHDRPAAWACRPQSWPDADRPPALPHPSTLSRRGRRPALRAAAARVHLAAVARLRVRTRYAALDGRPLVVGGASGDPEATAGRAVRGLGRGYKLHALVAAGVIVSMVVAPLHASEPVMARRLVARAPRRLTRLVADANYDGVPLHRVAAAHGKRLYTPIRNGRVGRRRQPERLRVLRVVGTPAGRRLLRGRDAVERAFARMSNIGCGYKGLPAWVRRRDRVEAWMWGKVVVYHAHLIHCRQRAA